MPRKTKTLKVCCTCMATYTSEIEVPAYMTLEQALDYAEQHLDTIPIQELNYISDSDELDRENCDFNE